jgi:mannose-6-phosphate isomerase-like protein (cupin superfamily)
MMSPPGWVEPAQTPEFAEYTVVLKGTLRVESKGATLDVEAGRAVIVHTGEWLRHSTPNETGAEYLAVFLPAFSPDIVHRKE